MIVFNLDSEDVSTVSPGSSASFSSFSSLSPPCQPCPAPEQREPLSLVVRRQQTDSVNTPKHWKKSISRNYSGEEERSAAGPLSPSTSTTAEALLSLGSSLPAPAPRVLPVALAPTRPVSQPRIVQPWTTPAVSAPVPHSSVSLSVRRDLCDISNVSLFPSHPLPPIHFRAEPPAPASLHLLSLPQQPAPLREVQSNLQLSSKPPFPVTAPVPKIKSEGAQPWHLAPPAASPAPLFRHSVFKSENIEEGSGARDKPFHCHECKKSFSTQSGFAKHQQLHCSNQIQRETTCKYCGKCYNSTSALKMHIRTHTLPCKCKECGKSFSRPWLLQGHLRTHTGEKPFACTECKRTFADKSNLRAHLQTHLQNKKYCCPGCQKTFSRMSLLTKHTDSGCLGLQSRNDECVETLTMMSSGLLRS